MAGCPQYSNVLMELLIQNIVRVQDYSDITILNSCFIVCLFVFLDSNNLIDFYNFDKQGWRHFTVFAFEMMSVPFRLRRGSEPQLKLMLHEYGLNIKFTQSVVASK